MCGLSKRASRFSPSSMTYPTSPRTRWPEHSAELRIASTPNGGQHSDSPLPEVARQPALGARRPIAESRRSQRPSGVWRLSRTCEHRPVREVPRSAGCDVSGCRVPDSSSPALCRVLSPDVKRERLQSPAHESALESSVGWVEGSAEGDDAFDLVSDVQSESAAGLSSHRDALDLVVGRADHEQVLVA